MTTYAAGALLRCIAPRNPSSRRSPPCGGYVARVPAVFSFELVGLVAHSDLAAPEHDVRACMVCGFLHEVRLTPTPRGRGNE